MTIVKVDPAGAIEFIHDAQHGVKKVKDVKDLRNVSKM